jgi:hypothetical protein
VPFAEKLIFSHGVGSENWRYFPEKLTSPEKFLTIKLFGDGLAIMLQKVCLNRKFLADF